MATASLPLTTLLPPEHEGAPTRIRIDSGAIVELEFVQSARVKGVGYDEESSTLFLQFPNGPVYAYDGVEQDVYEQLVTAESIGKFANEHIIGSRQNPSRYKFRKVVAEGDPYDRRDSFRDDYSIAGASAGAGIRIVEDHLAPRSETPAPEPGPAPELPAEDAKLIEYAIAARTAAAALTVRDEKLGIIIGSPQGYRAAEEKLVALKRERELVAQRVLRVYDPAYKTYIEARTLRDDALRPYDEAEQLLKSAMLAFGRKEAEDRRAAEIAHRRELERQAAETAKEQGREEAERTASYLEAQGEPEEAQRVRATPMPIAPAPVPAVVLPSSVPSTGKSSRREKWEFRIIDEREIPVTFAPAIGHLLASHNIRLEGEALTKFCRSLGPIFAEFYTLDQKAIRERACRLKLHANIAGVEVFDEGSIAVRK